jgi:exopolysaccharide production protein ExoZ
VRVSDNKGVIRPIQYLRGIAALMVVWHHALVQIPGTSAFLHSNFGTSGVDLFFVISGFIMAGITYGKNVSPWSFLKRRILRVAPLYWLVTLAMVACAMVAPSLFRTLKVEADTLVMSLLFIPHVSSSFAPNIWPLLVPGWTLNYEMFFYVLFAASLLVPASWRIAVLLACLLSLVIGGGQFNVESSALLQTYTNPMLLEFAGGVLVGHVWASGRLQLPWQISLVFVVLGSAMLVMRDSQPLMFFTQLIGAVLVVTGVLSPKFDEKTSPRLQALGDASYSIYLTHLFTLGAARVLWSKIHPGAPTAASSITFVVLAILASAIVGSIVHRWIEKPMLSWLQPRKVQSVPGASVVAH